MAHISTNHTAIIFFYFYYILSTYTDIQTHVSHRYAIKPVNCISIGKNDWIL